MVLSRYAVPRSMQFQLTVCFVIAPLSTAGAVPFHLLCTYAGEQLRDQFGYAAQPAGDVTGDGFEETLVPGHWRVDVFDARGRHVAHVFAGFLAPGAQALAWNGRASNGMPAPAGVYSIRATCKTHTLSTRAIVVH